MVGFDRTLELAWLDATVGFVADGLEPLELRRRLFAYLEGVVAGTSRSSARGKTVTVLTRIWSNVSPGVASLRDDALRLYADATPDTRLALHWALIIATYPYFLDVATHAGRLLGLHGEVHVTQLTRRLGEGWGERDLIRRTAQLATRSMALWGILRVGARAGVYEIARAPVDVGSAARLLLAESMLLGGGRSALSAPEIASHPALFPFAMTFSAGELRAAGRLEVHRTGLDTDLVSRRIA